VRLDEHGNHTHDEDPEVHADIGYREASKHDHTRTRAMAPALGGDRSIVTEWPCRAKCGRQVGVTETTLEVWRMFSKTLRARGEDGLDASAIVYCDACRAAIMTREGTEARKYTDRMREIVGQLKDAVATGNAPMERELTKKLQGRHPDVTGLVESLRNSKRTKRGGSHGRDL
jgi:hypothetical protein